MNALAPVPPTTPPEPVPDGGHDCDRDGCPCLRACVLSIRDGADRFDERLCWPHGRATYRALRGLPGIAAGLRPLVGGEW